MKKNVLVVGFGAMGCRHAQSLLHGDDFNLYVVEPDSQTFEKGIEKICASHNMVTRVDLRSQLPQFDFAVVATSSGPRYSITKDLLEFNVKNILLEKVVFQSIP